MFVKESFVTIVLRTFWYSICFQREQQCDIISLNVLILLSGDGPNPVHLK